MFFKKHDFSKSYGKFRLKSSMNFMPHVEQYSVIYSQQEGTLELIICVIHPSIPSLLNYCFLSQYKFAFYCFG